MEWVEVTGKTMEEAKSVALDQLGVDEQDAEFEVLEEPRAGLFGRLRSEARVRARVLPTAPRPKLERRDRRRQARPKPDAEQRPAGDGTARGRTARGSTDRNAPDHSNRDRKATDREGATPMSEQYGGGRGGSRGAERDHDDGPSVAEQGEEARTFLVGLMEALELEATVEIRPIDEEAVEVAISGDDVGFLIGPKGQTLTAVQELARTVVQRRLASRTGRLLVEVGDYRKKRRAALERFTREVAEQVLESGVSRVLEPMPPADRKVVHDTVNEIDGVRTTSEGEEPERSVVLLPEDDALPGPGSTSSS